MPASPDRRDVERILQNEAQGWDNGKTLAELAESVRGEDTKENRQAMGRYAAANRKEQLPQGRIFAVMPKDGEWRQYEVMTGDEGFELLDYKTRLFYSTERGLLDVLQAIETKGILSFDQQTALLAKLHLIANTMVGVISDIEQIHAAAAAPQLTTPPASN